MKHQWRMAAVPLTLALPLLAWGALPTLQVAQQAWTKLSGGERESIQKRFLVDVLPATAFGVIIDTQGVDESRPGTNGGAVLGSAIGNAAYIDSAISRNSYSAKGQLAAGLLGALVGSTLDSKGVAQYHFRYAVRLGNGNVQYVDQITREPFRHAAGVCISVPAASLLPSEICGQTADALRASYLTQPDRDADTVPAASTNSTAASAPAPTPDTNSKSTLVSCKLGTLAPVQTTAEKCELIKGVQVQ